MYKKYNKRDIDGNVIGLAPMVERLSDNAFIPFDEANTDYQEYLKWLDGYEMNEMGEWVKVSEGNTPEPADE